MQNTRALQDLLIKNGYTKQFNQALYDSLYDLGYRGQLNEMMFRRLRDLGYEGSFNTMVAAASEDSFDNFLSTLALASELVGDQWKLSLDTIDIDVVDGPALTSLTVDGTDILNLVTNPTSPELATVTEPGVETGSGRIVSAITEPLEVGALYLVSYEILENSALENLYSSFGGGSPFDDGSGPMTLGVHHRLMIAENTDTTALFRIVGTATFGTVSCRKAEWNVTLPIDTAISSQIEATVTYGTKTRDLEIYTPIAGSLYVAPEGDDVTGTGAPLSPFRQPTRASELAIPGDTVYLRPGRYTSLNVTTSGTVGNPITFTTLPGEERLAILQGDLLTHSTLGGPGAGPEDDDVRNGVSIWAQDYITISNLVIQDWWGDCINIRGDRSASNQALLGSAVRHGNHIISNNIIRNCGSVGIWCSGWDVGTSEDPALFLTENIIIEYNDISETNRPTDYNQENAQDEPGGVNEAISAVGGVANIITRFNDIHDSRQYGVDYKHNVSGGAIHDNRVWNMERYGIYLDTNRRTVEDIDVYDNTVWQCDLGIVLSREADFDPVADADGTDMLQTLRNINVYNNEVYDCRGTGIYCQKHPGDSPHGEITNVRIYDNNAYNCSTGGTGNEARLTGWASADFLSAGIVTGFEFTDNRLTRTHDLSSQPLLVESFSGEVGFTLSGTIEAETLAEAVVPAIPFTVYGETREINPFTSDALKPFRFGLNRIPYDAAWGSVGAGWRATNFSQLLGQKASSPVSLNGAYQDATDFEVGFEIAHRLSGGVRVELTDGATPAQGTGGKTANGIYSTLLTTTSQQNALTVTGFDRFVGTVQAIEALPIEATLTSASVDVADGTVSTDGNTITFTPAVGVTGDAVISYTVAHGGLSETSTANVALAPTLENFTNANPIYLAHRGVPLIYKEYAPAGFARVLDEIPTKVAIECDVHTLSDGNLAVSHDPTADVGTNGTGDLSNFTTDQWRALTVDYHPNTPGTLTYRAQTLDEVLATHGRGAMYTIEVKDRAAAEPTVATLLAAGIPLSNAIVSSFDMRDLEPAVAAGYQTMINISSGTSRIADALEEGVGWVCLRASNSEADIQAWGDAGFKVTFYTLQRRGLFEDFKAMHANVVGAYFDDAIYASGDYSRTQDEWADGKFMPGMLHHNEYDTLQSFESRNADRRGTILDGGWLGWDEDPGNSQRDFILQGWATAPADEGNTNYDVNFTLRITDGSSTRWAAIAIHSAAHGDGSFADAGVAGQDAYNILMRKDGDMQLYKVTGSSFSLLDSDGTPAAFDPTDEIEFRLEVRPTGVTLNRLSGATVVGSVTTTDTDLLGAYFSLGRRAVECAFKDVSVTRY